MKHLCIMYSFALLLLGSISSAVLSAPFSPNTNPASTAITIENSRPESLNPIPMKDIQRFVTAVAQIKHYYIKSVNYSQLFNHAIRGMLVGLDPHSSLLDQKAVKDLKTVTTGEFSGLGIEILPEKSFIQVVSPIDDTPAARAGLKPGDIIIKIDGEPVKSMTTDEAIEKMRGKKGSKVILTTLKKGQHQPTDISIIRDVIKIKTVKSRLLIKDYGYIRIAFFHAPTAKHLRIAISELQKANKAPLKGVIIDLRNNPGGLLTSAIEVANTFLSYPQHHYHNLIVYTKGRISHKGIKNTITQKDLLNHTPLVILINQGSASAAEIVAGALQDYKRALIVGNKSFGKGSVQTVLPISEDTAIKLTTALYYTPAGRSIQAYGIQPDVTIPALQLAKHQESAIDIFGAIGESNLNGHIKAEDRKARYKPLLKEEAEANQAAHTLAKQDFQLFVALKLLEGLHKTTSTH